MSDKPQKSLAESKSSLKNTAWFLLGLDLAFAAICWSFRRELFGESNELFSSDTDLPALIVCVALLGCGVILFCVLNFIARKSETTK